MEERKGAGLGEALYLVLLKNYAVEQHLHLEAIGKCHELLEIKKGKRKKYLDDLATKLNNNENNIDGNKKARKVIKKNNNFTIVNKDNDNNVVI